MGNIFFSCPICSEDLQVDDRLKGGLVRCSSCESTVMVPMTGIREGMNLGRYSLEMLLGKGGMGQVWLAHDEFSDEDVAIKILSPALVASPAAVAKFMREIEISSRFQHPNLVRVMNASAENGLYYYVTPYIEGETLKEKIDKETVLYDKDMLKIAKQVAEALKYVWSEFKVIHSDISPSNIMLDYFNSVKILDLGIARTAENDKHLTQTGVIVGSPHYMSPEQAIEDRSLDFRADMYALGATMYHAVTGRVPFDGQNAISIITKHVNDSLALPRSVNPNVSEHCSALIGRMMAKDRNDRPSSWDELIRAIDKVIKGEAPLVKLQRTGQSEFENTNFQKINLKALRQIEEQETPQAVKSEKPSPDKIAKSNKKKNIAERTARKKHLGGKSPKRKEDVSKRIRMAKLKGKKDNTPLVVGIIAGVVLVLFFIGFGLYMLDKSRKDARLRDERNHAKKNTLGPAPAQAGTATTTTTAQPASTASTTPARVTAPAAKKATPAKLDPQVQNWVNANTLRGQTEKAKVGTELTKVDELVQKGLKATGKILKCSPAGGGGAVKASDLLHELDAGMIIQFEPGNYNYVFDIPVINNVVAQGSAKVKLQNVRVFGEDGMMIIRNLACKSVKITGNCLFVNCVLDNVVIDQGTAIFSQCNLLCLKTTNNQSKIFLTKCRVSAQNFRFLKGIISLQGPTILKMVKCDIDPRGNPGFGLGKDFSGKIYLQECYLPPKKLAFKVDGDEKKEEFNDWQHLVKLQDVTCVDCVTKDK